MHFKPPHLLPEFIFRTSRSGGKGGQNVNKVSTKVMVAFPVLSSKLLSGEEKKKITEKLGDKLTAEGYIQVVSQEARSQLANKETAIRKMYQVLNACFREKKKRKATKPPGKSIEKRLSDKKKVSETKAMRGGKEFSE